MPEPTTNQRFVQVSVKVDPEWHVAFVSMCGTCGSFVADQDQHVEWHRKNDSGLSTDEAARGGSNIKGKSHPHLLRPEGTPPQRWADGDDIGRGSDDA